MSGPHRSPPPRAAPCGQGGKVQRKPRSQGSRLFVSTLGEGQKKQTDVNNTKNMAKEGRKPPPAAFRGLGLGAEEVLGGTHFSLRS